MRINMDELAHITRDGTTISLPRNVLPDNQRYVRIGTSNGYLVIRPATETSGNAYVNLLYSKNRVEVYPNRCLELPRNLKGQYKKIFNIGRGGIAFRYA